MNNSNAQIDNGVGFLPPKQNAKKGIRPKQDSTGVYLRTLVNQNEEIITLLSQLVDIKQRNMHV